jgi:putative flippase GtrA
MAARYARCTLSVGAAIGPYITTKKVHTRDGEEASMVSAFISVTAAYAINPRWTGRMTWSRVATNYDRDTDVVLFGLGSSF